jgi:hypothetical protein
MQVSQEANILLLLYGSIVPGLSSQFKRGSHKISASGGGSGGGRPHDGVGTSGLRLCAGERAEGVEVQVAEGDCDEAAHIGAGD